jgi:hypothetical protein
MIVLKFIVELIYNICKENKYNLIFIFLILLKKITTKIQQDGVVGENLVSLSSF